MPALKKVAEDTERGAYSWKSKQAWKCVGILL